ncbi:M48 family metalloprotease [Neorhodopirellula pilleata]|uniref:Peptidase family M48 n=1 Tax=Neorhodopirellula pilleata TaxID=2714738 RepID=A0A5C6AR32_9BACT|nr:M48 family metalloprotease [Neorhodopirellula pilleata]TWU01957.1 Peptidase family M48 [Neorhodopirellula pilleata]
MTLYIFLLVIVSLMCGSAPANGDLSVRCVWATLAMLSGWIILGHVSARWMARQVLRGEVEFNVAANGLRSQLDIFRWFALPIVIMCLYGFSLSAYSRAQPVIQSSMFLQAIVLLSPGFSLLVSTWSAEYYFAVAVGTQPRRLGGYLSAMTRMFRSGPAWLIVPTLTVMAAGDLLQQVQVRSESWDHWIGDAIVSWLPAMLLVIGSLVVFALPWLVRWLAKTEPIDGSTESEIRCWLRRCGFSTHWLFGMQVARWDTGGRMLNAMVAGVIRPGRLLLMSDRLLDELPRGQRMLVVMHELAHVKRWHVPLRMAAILPAWFVSSYCGEFLIEYGWFDETVGAAIGAVSGLVTTIVCLGLVSHFCELDADAVACRLAVRASRRTETETEVGVGAASALDSPVLSRMPEAEMTIEMAAELMADALVRVTADHPASRKVSWLHPSLATRVGRLRRISYPLPDQRAEGHTWAL